MTPQEMLAHISDYLDQRGDNLGDIDAFCMVIYGGNEVEGVTFGPPLSVVGALERVKLSILNRPRQASDKGE